MKNREPMKRLMMFGLSLLLVTMETMLFAWIWYQNYAEMIDMPFFHRGNWMVILVYAMLTFIITRLYGGYRLGYLKRGDVFFSAEISMLLVHLLTYFQISCIGRKFLDWRPLLFLTILDTVLIAGWVVSGHSLYLKFCPPRRMLVVYGEEYPLDFIHKMNRQTSQHQVCEAISIYQGIDRIYERTGDYDTVAVWDVPSQQRNDILKFCFRHSIRIYLVPKISDTIIRGADCVHMMDTPLLLCKNMGLSPEQEILKRAVDIALSLLLLILLFPVMGIIALAVKWQDGGPALYTQERLTKNGRIFRIYKFRSMIVDAEKRNGPQLAEAGDARITSIGKLLRRFRLDELPQLVNILRGEMSFVGPRPERPEIAAEYAEAMPEFDFRLKVKAGLTGYAQVMGRYTTTPMDKLKLDLMYIATYHTLLDFKLILMTAKVLFLPSSSEGIPIVPQQTNFSVPSEEHIH